MGSASQFYACRKNTLHEALSTAKKTEEENPKMGGRGGGSSAAMSAPFITPSFFFRCLRGKKGERGKYKKSLQKHGPLW
jgi:hypothetical protein